MNDKIGKKEAQKLKPIHYELTQKYGFVFGKAIINGEEIDSAEQGLSINKFLDKLIYADEIEDAYFGFYNNDEKQYYEII